MRLFCPRISEARRLLPAVRRELVGRRLPLSLVYGAEGRIGPDCRRRAVRAVELVPDRKTHTYVTIGCDATGEPTLRKTLYGDGARNALQLVAADGRTKFATLLPKPTERRIVNPLPGLGLCSRVGVGAASRPFSGKRPRQPVVIAEHVHQCLDQALSIAHSYLAKWVPFTSLLRRAKRGPTGIRLDGTRGARRTGLPTARHMDDAMSSAGGQCTNRGQSRYLMRMAPATNTSIARSTSCCPIARSAHLTKVIN